MDVLSIKAIIVHRTASDVSTVNLPAAKPVSPEIQSLTSQRATNKSKQTSVKIYIKKLNVRSRTYSRFAIIIGKIF